MIRDELCCDLAQTLYNYHCEFALPDAKNPSRGLKLALLYEYIDQRGGITTITPQFALLNTTGQIIPLYAALLISF